MEVSDALSSQDILVDGLDQRPWCSILVGLVRTLPSLPHYQILILGQDLVSSKHHQLL